MEAYRPHTEVALISPTVRELFAKLSHIFPNYKERMGQLEMADHIESALETSSKLVIEAGTGIGKTFAYLLPVVKWALDNDKVGVIATFTKTLQHQILHHDIPWVKRVLGDFTVSLAVGANNYLCLRRWNKLLATGELPQRIYEKLSKWIATTDTGLREEFESSATKPEAAYFDEIAKIPELCAGKKCKFRDRCYYERAKRVWRQSSIVILNHHLLFADLKIGGALLPPYDVLVIDEAHNLEDVAVEYFGIRLTNFQLPYNLRLLIRDLPYHELASIVTKVESTNTKLFHEIATLFGHGTHRVTAPLKMGAVLFDTLDELINVLKGLQVSDPEEYELKSRYITRFDNWRYELSCFMEQTLTETVYWVEVRSSTRSGVKVELHTAPLDVAPYLHELLWQRDIPIIFTSATLAVDNNLGYWKTTVGLDDTVDLVLASPFDYYHNMLVYVPKYGVEPDQSGYLEFVASEVTKLIKLSHGKALVLFTNLDIMDKIYSLTVSGLPTTLQRTFMKQGDRSRTALLTNMQKLGGVLFGADTYWQGIDLPGPSLVMLIITRLPFKVPDSPIVQAKIELIKSHGGNPFWKYQLPQAIMKLRQGVGRLIRRESDYGVVAILDTRIMTRSYGKKFWRSLPNIKVTHSIEEVYYFLQSKERLTQPPQDDG